MDSKLFLFGGVGYISKEARAEAEAFCKREGVPFVYADAGAVEGAKLAGLFGIKSTLAIVLQAVGKKGYREAKLFGFAREKEIKEAYIGLIKEAGN